MIGKGVRKIILRDIDNAVYVRVMRESSRNSRFVVRNAVEIRPWHVIWRNAGTHIRLQLRDCLKEMTHVR